MYDWVGSEKHFCTLCSVQKWCEILQVVERRGFEVEDSFFISLAPTKLGAANACGVLTTAQVLGDGGFVTIFITL